jgi:hypothetical protein
MKLSLNKIAKGHYQKIAGDIVVTVEKVGFDEYWRGTIEQYSHTAKDFSGNDVKCYDTIFEWKSLTKKELCKTMVEFIQNS